MTDCIFCKIVRKEIPALVVYEDNLFLAFLDIHPRGTGHTQIIPKQHYRWVWDVPEIGPYFEVVRKIALAQKEAFGAELIRSQVFGEDVAHAHVWVWPNTEKNMADLKDNVEKIRAAL
ncbi:MAG: HIT family protein [Patescibacteria group bacterium]